MEKINTEFLLASLKTLTFSKDRSENTFSVPAFLCYRLSILSGVHSWPTIEKISASQAAFGTPFGITGDYRKTGTCSLKRATGRTLRIIEVTDFIKASRNFFRLSAQKASHKL